jgi:CheY-like chemotaxis protein
VEISLDENREKTGSMKVLIADDQHLNLEILVSALEPLALDVFEASDGHEALAVARKIRPDLVLLDVLMPKMSGLEVCRILKEEARKEGKFLPVLLITAREDLESKIEGLEVSGADDYIVKPFESRELVARVRVLIRTMELQKSLVENERLKVLFEMAGAAAHEINQPLCAISCYLELMQYKLADDGATAEEIRGIADAVERISRIVQKLSAIKRYSTKPYLYDENIIDLDMSSQA